MRSFGRLFDPNRLKTERPLSSALTKQPAISVCCHEELEPDAELLRRLLAERGYSVLSRPAAAAPQWPQSSGTRPFFLTAVSAQGEPDNGNSSSLHEAPGLVIALLSERFLESDRCVRALKTASVARTPLVLALCAPNVLPGALGGSENHRATGHHVMPSPDTGPGRSWQVSAKRPPSVPTQVRAF